MKSLILGAIATAAVGTMAAGEAKADHNDGRRGRSSFNLWVGNGGFSFGINRGYVPRRGVWNFGNRRGFNNFGWNNGWNRGWNQGWNRGWRDRRSCDRNRGRSSFGRFGRSGRGFDRGRSGGRRGGRRR